MNKLVWLFLGLALLLAACGGGGGGARVNSVTITGVPSPARIAVGASVDLDATVSVSGGASQSVTWDSSDESKATVDADGVVTGVAEGNATITATSTADPSKSASVELMVGAEGEGVVNGLVTDSSSGLRLEGVRVSAAGQTVTSDEKGEFSFSGLPEGEVQLSFEKDGYAPGFANADLGSEPAAVLVTLKAQGELQDYDATGSATIYQSTEAGPYAVIFSANSLDTSDTDLRVSVTPLDPTKEAEALPGDLVTEDALLTPLTFAEFSIFDSQDRRVNLRAGASATVELPVPPSLRNLPQYELGKVIHCYSYNPETGQWEDFVVGTIVRSSVDGVTPVVRADIKHFSWYGAAPESDDCIDVIGQIVSAVDGRPLPYARVEAFPGTRAVADQNGVFMVTTTTDGPNEIVATRTYTDTDGSVSGMPGAKVIEFGKVKDVLIPGLVPKPCNGSSAQSPTPQAGSGTADDPLIIEIGYIGELSYTVDAWLFTETDAPGLAAQMRAAGVKLPEGLERLSPAATGSAFAFLSELLPNEEPGEGVAGATITLSGADGAETTLLELEDVPGYYYLDTAAGLEVTPGERYTLSVDADGNGSVDGAGSIFAVGDVSWTSPSEGETLAADGFTASWSDSAVNVNPAYSVLYYAWIYLNSDTEFDGDYYIGSEREFQPEHYLDEDPETYQPLPPGAYEGYVWAFSGPYDGTSGDFSATNNVTGASVNGRFYSWSGGSTAEVTFMLD